MSDVDFMRSRLERLERQIANVSSKPSAQPKQLGATEVARLLLERHASSASERSSVKLTRNAKGDTQIEVTVRTGESDDVATVADASVKARAVYDTLRGFYPMGEPE